MIYLQEHKITFHHRLGKGQKCMNNLTLFCDKRHNVFDSMKRTIKCEQSTSQEVDYKENTYFGNNIDTYDEDHPSKFKG